MTEPTTQAAHSGTCPSDCSQPSIFNGDDSLEFWSLEFWSKINRLSEQNGRFDLFELMYELGCKLQELESRVARVENYRLHGREGSEAE